MIHRIGGLLNPQGAGIAPPLNRLFIADTLDGAVRIFDATTFAELRATPLGVDADNVRYDSNSAIMYVGYGDKNTAARGPGSALPDAGLAALNASDGSILGVAALPVHPESFQLASSSALIYVNLPEANGSIAVVNRSTRSVSSLWTLALANGTRLQGNYPMALDEQNNRLFVGCRRPAVLAVVDTASGAVVAALPSVGDTDDVWYDAVLRRIYQTGGDGTLAVFQQRDPNTYELLATLPTGTMARTSYFAAVQRRLFVAVPNNTVTGVEAALWVFDAPSN